MKLDRRTFLGSTVSVGVTTAVGIGTAKPTGATRHEIDAAAASRTLSEHRHTSPIYFTVNGQGPAVAESIREGLLMLDHFEDHLRKQADEQYVEGVALAIDQARTQLRGRLTSQ